MVIFKKNVIISKELKLNLYLLNKNLANHQNLSSTLLAIIQHITISCREYVIKESRDFSTFKIKITVNTKPSGPDI